MKFYAVMLAVFFVNIFLSTISFGQKKKEAKKDSFPTYDQIMPKFSEMMDHDMPASVMVFRDGKMEVSKSQEITVPAQKKDIRRNKSSSKKQKIK